MKPILLFSLALALSACSGNKNDFDATGAFESTEIIVSSEANGKIMELNLQEGDRLVFEDMALYTMVKTNTFNGMPLPAILWRDEQGQGWLVKEFGYEDFKNRLS